MVKAYKTTIIFQGGHGGHGCSSLRRAKYNPKGGPDGGNGGNGGNIMLVANKNVKDLLYLDKKHIFGNNGEHGRTRAQHGKQGSVLKIYVPLGTQVWKNSACIADLNEHDKSINIAQGGKGGLGNKHFASSVLQAPRHSSKGTPGEISTITLIYICKIDIGIIGLPNTGKSTLFFNLSNVKTIIESYPFSSRDITIGYMDNIALLDTPPLTSKSHQNQGLGNYFLQHLHKCMAILICINSMSDIQIILEQIRLFNPLYLDKKIIIILNSKFTIQDMASCTYPLVCSSDITKIKQYIKDATLFKID